MIGGIGETGYSPASSTLLADVFSRAKRARMLSWWSIASLFGFLAGNILGGVLGSGGRWRRAFLGMGLGGLVLAWLAWRIPEPVREQPEQVMSAREEAARPVWARIADMPDRLWHFWEQVLLLLRVKSLLAVIVMLGGAFFVLYTTGVYLPTLLQQKDLFGLSATDAGLVNGVVGAGAGIVGTLLGGYLMDGLSRRWSGVGLLVCGVGFLLSVPCLGLEIFLGFTTHSLALFVGFHFVVLLLVSLLEGMVGVTVQDVVPTDQRASALAIVSLASSLLGEFFSPLLVGAMAVLFDPTRGQHFMQGQAGHDLGLALIASCVPALVLAGVVGMLAMCWMKVDQQNARIPFMKC